MNSSYAFVELVTRGAIGLFWAVGFWLACSSASGQMVGSRSVESGGAGGRDGSPLLSPEVAIRYIIVTGTAERTVAPSELRLIWAITAEDAEPSRCREQLRAQVEAVSNAWRQIGIPADQVVEDFIAALPRYEWVDEVRQETPFLVEKRTGYRIQTNLHVRAGDERQAQQVVDAALATGVTDLIGVDYMADLGAVQVATRQAALEAARAKSQQLLTPLFETMPRPINVAEQTQVHFPPEQYASFENVAADEYGGVYRDDRRRIIAYRPRNTYYRGSIQAADDRSYELPMSPKIVVESTVQIYYLSPAATIVPAIPTPK